MYESSFGLTEAPFSISPDPRYLYMSQRHQEAMAHLRYGIQEAGGFVQLTGEVGTGKTTICRCMLEQLPDNVDVALILNPQISHSELLATLCDEIGVSYPPNATPKKLLDVLNEHLIEAYSQGRRTVLVIDEAQILTRAVLEQIRILTNLETTKQKLLQIILIGQPELNATLSRADLRQLTQRITAKYHLEPLMKHETAEYIKYRLAVAGCQRPVFTRAAVRRVYKLSHGVPRLINVICDRALLGAYSRNSDTVTAAMVTKAGREMFGGSGPGRRKAWLWGAGVAVACALSVAAFRPQWLEMAPAGLEVPWLRAAEDSAEPTSRVETSGAAGDAGRPAEAAAPGRPRVTPVGVARDPAKPTAPLGAVLDQDGLAHSRSEALARLLDAWGMAFDRSSGLSCTSVTRAHGLRCLTERGTLDELRRLNRVVALLLRHQGDEIYLLLTGIDDDLVSVSVAGRVQRVARRDIESMWEGDYVLLWRAPPQGTTTIAEHSEGVDVLWLRQTLNRVPYMEPADVDNSVFDSLLKQKVMAFQRSNNLKVDGEADMHTIMRLNTVVDPDVPKLGAAKAG